MKQTLFLIFGCIVAFSCTTQNKPDTAEDTKPEFDRRIQLEGEHNFRDLGGYQTAQNQSLKKGMIYRSGSLHKLTVHDQNKLEELGIKTVVNFLTPNEIAKQGEDLLPEGVVTINLPIEGMGNEVDDLIEARITGDFSKIPIDFNYNIHEILPESGKEQYAAFFEVIMDSNNYPLVFHCSHGVHRTGTATALLLSAMNVPWETIRQDYVLSSEYRLPESTRRIKQLDSLARFNGVTNPEENLNYINAFYLLQPEYIDGTKEHIEKDYSSFDSYLNTIYMSQEKIDYLKTQLLE
ncbi:MAG: tyrosine-protein phosphatase [Schleiferiaceae bacterium]|jgi:protein-tyrosine phosphatase|nr:tyrosine-protein phosphatase [Schleiferiaceae bacterium]